VQNTVISALVLEKRPKMAVLSIFCKTVYKHYKNKKFTNDTKRQIFTFYRRYIFKKDEHKYGFQLA